MTLELTANGQSFRIEMDDTETTWDLLSLLPLTLTLEDYAHTEKIAYLPRKLTTTGAPAGSTPKAGDLTYYAPWGNLALFYRDSPYAAGLVPLGRLTAGLNVLQPLDKVEVTLSQVSKE